MAETPTGDPGEAFGMLEALLGIAPFLIVGGIVTGLAAAALTYPIVIRTGTGFRPGRTTVNRQFAVPVSIGAIALPISGWVVMLSHAEQPLDSLWRVLAPPLLVACALATAVWYVTFRDAERWARRQSLYSYAAFVLVWVGLVAGVSVAWLT